MKEHKQHKLGNSAFRNGVALACLGLVVALSSAAMPLGLAAYLVAGAGAAMVVGGYCLQVKATPGSAEKRAKQQTARFIEKLNTDIQSKYQDILPPEQLRGMVKEAINVTLSKGQEITENAEAMSRISKPSTPLRKRIMGVLESTISSFHIPHKPGLGAKRYNQTRELER